MYRIGTGYDAHRFSPDRPLILGGVKIPFTLGLLGHSDADVLSHTITDALLGAVALGSIGHHFPDTDPQYKNADSIVLLQKAYALVIDTGYEIVNIDATLIAQEPKLNPFLNAIRERLAKALSLSIDQVSVKATTTEKMGPEGRLEGMSAQASVLVKKR